MKINIKTAVQIQKSKKVFFVYKVENNYIHKSILTNDLTRHRQAYGQNTKFILVDILKKQTNNLTINL